MNETNDTKSDGKIIKIVAKIIIKLLGAFAIFVFCFMFYHNITLVKMFISFLNHCMYGRCLLSLLGIIILVPLETIGIFCSIYAIFGNKIFEE